MYEKMRLFLGQLLEKSACPRLMPLQPSVLPDRPSDQRLVEVPEDRIHRRPAEPSVIFQPTPEDWIVQPGDVRQAQFRSISVVQFAGCFPHGLDRRLAHRRGEAHIHAVAFAVFH